MHDGQLASGGVHEVQRAAGRAHLCHRQHDALPYEGADQVEQLGGRLLSLVGVGEVRAHHIAVVPVLRRQHQPPARIGTVQPHP